MRRRFRSADALLRAYFSAHQRAQSPRGMQVAQRGRSYAGRCSNRKCGRQGRPIGQPNGQGEIVQRCPQCGAPWAYSDVFELSGQARSGRGGRPPRAVVDAGDLCLFAHRLEQARSLEPGHAQVFLRYVFDGRYSQRTLAAKLSEERFMEKTWHTRDVRRAVERSTAVLERDLLRRGMLER